VRAAALVLFLGASACSDPTIDVTIDIPDAYRSMVSSITLADYERDGLTCDAIAFGDESAAALDGALTTQVEVAPGASAGLTGISRVDHKVLVARGRDAGGELVVAGCRELDALDGSVTVDLPTIAAALVTIDPRRPDAPLDLADPITVHALDPLGMPLEHRDVVWRVFGPKGAPGGVPGAASCPMPGVDGCTSTQAGDANVAASPPSAPGPALVEVHVEWARAQPAPVAAFELPLADGFSLRTLTKNVDTPSCTIYRAANGPRVACIAIAVGGSKEIQHFEWNGSAMQELATSPSVPGAVALIAASLGATDRVIAITDTGDFVDGTTGATLGHVTLPAAAVAAQLVPACGKSPFVVIGLANGKVVTTDTAGATIVNFVTSSPTDTRQFSLAAAGCVSDLVKPATLYRGVVLLESKNMTSVPYAQIDGPTMKLEPKWAGLGDGVGFLDVGGGEFRLATGRLDLSGVVIDESRIDPTREDTAQLASMAQHDSITVPAAIASGDLDGDGQSDRAWLLVGGGLRPPGRVQIELAATAHGVPIAGVSPEIGTQPTGLLVADLDGDGIDDVIVYGGDTVVMVLAGRSP